MKKELIIPTLSLFLLPFVTGCVSSGTRVRHTNYHPRPQYHSNPGYPGYRGQSHATYRDRYGNVRRETRIWNNGSPHYHHRQPIGLPRHMTPRNIQRKFRQDVERLRRQR